RVRLRQVKEETDPVLTDLPRLAVASVERCDFAKRGNEEAVPRPPATYLRELAVVRNHDGRTVRGVLVADEWVHQRQALKDVPLKDFRGVACIYLSAALARDVRVRRRGQPVRT